MTCPKCGAPNREGVEYCGECGKTLVKKSFSARLYPFLFRLVVVTISLGFIAKPSFEAIKIMFVATGRDFESLQVLLMMCSFLPVFALIGIASLRWGFWVMLAILLLMTSFYLYHSIEGTFTALLVPSLIATAIQFLGWQFEKRHWKRVK
jgi:hypothetical protein